MCTLWINRYKGSPWYKTVLKELYFACRFAWLFVANGLRNRTVLFYPEFPLYRTEINKVLRAAGYNITNNPRLGCQHALVWQDTTFRDDLPLLDDLARRGPVLNLSCGDISKQRVERLFARVFGYGLAVDPTTHRGPCVCKSEHNGLHDAQVVNCPIAAPRDGFVYQRLLDTRVSDPDGQPAASDFRLPVYGASIPYVLRRFRPMHSRFSGDYRVELHPVEAFFSQAEIQRVLCFTREFGLDYGDLDILRDPADGRLYIVDVNNTPFSATAIGRADAKRAQALAQAAFEREFGVPAGTVAQQPQ